MTAYASGLSGGPAAWRAIGNLRGDQRAAPWTLLPSLLCFHSGSHLIPFPTGRLVTATREGSSLMQSPVF